jgi:glycosyltransferase involved in cell wall biosynthesis
LLEHVGRLAVSALPGVRSRVWTGPAEAVPSGALRVLLLVPEYPPGETGGIASYARELALGLAEVGHQVDVLVVRRDQRTEDVRDGPITVHRRPQVRLVPGRRLGGRFGRLGNASFVQRLEHALSCRTHSGKSGGPFDVVETCEWMAGGLFLSAQRTPVVLHVHGAAALVERRGAPSPAARISEMLETLAMRRCDLVTVPSSAMAERVRAQVGRRHRIRVVPCPTEVRGEVAPALGGPPAVLYVGRLDWLKAPEVLLQAGVLLREQVPDVEIRFVGRPSGRHDGVPYGEWLADLAEREKSPCLFLGERNRAEVLSAIAGSSVVAITSRFEAFGLSAAEALGQGRPVVCTDPCGISYLVSPPAGLVVPFGDPYALADALLQFLPGGSLAAEAPGAALEVARRYLSRPVVAREKLACYREAIGS